MNLTGQKIDKSKYDAVIGIDPGVNTGYADIVESKKMELFTDLILNVIDYVQCIFYNYKVLIRIENPKTYIPFKGMEKENQSKLQGAGSIKRDLSIWVEFCEMRGIDYELVSLHSSFKKLSAEQFKKITGYKGRTSSHSRDAAMLVWNFFD